MCCSVVPCVLKCVAVCCSVTRMKRVRYGVLQCVTCTLCYRALPCVLRCVALCCSVTDMKRVISNCWAAVARCVSDTEIVSFFLSIRNFGFDLSLIYIKHEIYTSARPYESCKIFKGRPRRNVFSNLVHRQYRSFPPDRFLSGGNQQHNWVG